MLKNMMKILLVMENENYKIGTAVTGTVAIGTAVAGTAPDTTTTTTDTDTDTVTTTTDTEREKETTLVANAVHVDVPAQLHMVRLHMHHILIHILPVREVKEVAAREDHTLQVREGRTQHLRHLTVAKARVTTHTGKNQAN